MSMKRKRPYPTTPRHCLKKNPKKIPKTGPESQKRNQNREQRREQNREQRAHIQGIRGDHEHETQSQTQGLVLREKVLGRVERPLAARVCRIPDALQPLLNPLLARVAAPRQLVLTFHLDLGNGTFRLDFGNGEVVWNL